MREYISAVLRFAVSNTASAASATETEFLIHGTGYTSNGGSIKSNTSEQLSVRRAEIPSRRAQCKQILWDVMLAHLLVMPSVLSVAELAFQPDVLELLSLIYPSGLRVR